MKPKLRVVNTTVSRDDVNFISDYFSKVTQEIIKESKFTYVEPAIFPSGAKLYSTPGYAITAKKRAFLAPGKKSAGYAGY